MPFALWFHKTSRSLSRTWTIEAVIKSIACELTGWWWDAHMSGLFEQCCVQSSKWLVSLSETRNKQTHVVLKCSWLCSDFGHRMNFATHVSLYAAHLHHQIMCEVPKCVDKVLTWRSNVVLISHLIGHVSSTVWWWWCWVVENRGSSHHT